MGEMADLYTCLGSPITPKMLTQILETMFPPLNVFKRTYKKYLIDGDD